MSTTAFSIVKDEAQFIGYSVMSILEHIDEIVYADGNSTDGTLELLEYIKATYDKDNKIKVLKGWDCANLTDDYTRLFNDLLKECRGDYKWFLHPDMIVTTPQNITNISMDRRALAYFVNVRSFAGDGRTEITKGRTSRWKSIMKDDFGLHYWGTYGHLHEDMYFDFQEHKVRLDMRSYPFEVRDSQIHLEHFCECKPRKRREEKMEKIARYGFGVTNDLAVEDLITNHPRVHLQSQDGNYGLFKFEPRKDDLPAVFAKYKAEFDEVIAAGRKG